jgi:hypothetical protein
VIFNKDAKTYQDFDDAFTSFSTSGTSRMNFAPQSLVPNVNRTQRSASVGGVNLFGQRSNTSAFNNFFLQHRQNDPNHGLIPKATSSPIFQGQGQRTPLSYTPIRTGPSYTPGGLQHIQSFPGAIASPGTSASYGNQQVSNQVPRKHHSKSSSADRHSSRSGRGSGHRGRSDNRMRSRDSAERDSSVGQSQEALRCTFISVF